TAVGIDVGDQDTVDIRRQIKLACFFRSEFVHLNRRQRTVCFLVVRLLWALSLRLGSGRENNGAFVIKGLVFNLLFFRSWFFVADDLKLYLLTQRRLSD